jgi:hypothetical protein
MERRVSRFRVCWVIPENNGYYEYSRTAFRFFREKDDATKYLEKLRGMIGLVVKAEDNENVSVEMEDLLTGEIIGYVYDDMDGHQFYRK